MKFLQAGWLVSRVEYTKAPSDELRVALVHFGAVSSECILANEILNRE